MGNDIHFFLAANSGGGFASLYDQLLDHAFDDLAIIKGGPGCGKSSLMRAVAAAAEAQGREAVYVRCSGDPDSLDAVILPELNTALVDGTSPHVLEPRYTAVHERYLDLSPFYDLAGVKTERGEIVRESKAYRAAYAESYQILRAVDAVEAERRSILRAAVDREKLCRRAEGIISRELAGKRKGGGSTAQIFLGGYTCKGEIICFDTVGSMCGRVYELVDSAGLGTQMLESICASAVAVGERVLVGKNPLRPHEVEHLLIPGRQLAFVTVSDKRPYIGESYRRVRLDAIAESTLSRSEKAHLRFIRRIRRSLEEEAVATLKKAKEAHDRLEQLYHPYVDFAAVTKLAEYETARILSR